MDGVRLGWWRWLPRKSSCVNSGTTARIANAMLR